MKSNNYYKNGRVPATPKTLVELSRIVASYSEKQTNLAKKNVAMVSGTANILHSLLMKRIIELKDLANHESGIIRFPPVFEKICRNFSISKQEAWELLFLLKDLNYIDIIPYQGIKIKS